MKDNLKFKRFMLQFLSGAVMLQTSGCTQVGTFVTTLASVVTAGGVIFIVSKVIRS